MNEQTPDLPVLKPTLQPYDPPAIVYESTLEVRAGSPLGLPDPLALPGQP